MGTLLKFIGRSGFFINLTLVVIVSCLLCTGCASTAKSESQGETAGLADEAGTPPSDSASAASTETAPPGDVAVGDTAMPPTEPSAATPTEGGDAISGLETPPPSGDVAANTPPLDAPTSIEAPTETPAVAEKAPAAPKASHASSGEKSDSGRIPKIPAESIQKKGKNLNRFYFVRQNDTPEKVSELLYGTPAMAKQLQMWNGKKWKPGTVAYYISPVKPEDHEMRSFYQEHNVPAEEYQVADGETLPKIAQAKLGHPASWKEIAVVNGITTAENLPPGTRIAIYPADLSSFAFNPEQQAQPMAENTPPPGSVQPPADGSAPQATPETAPPGDNAAPHEGEEGKKRGGLNLGKLLEQNMFAFSVAGALILLALLLMLVGRRRKARGADYTDETFSAKAKNK